MSAPARNEEAAGERGLARVPARRGLARLRARLRRVAPRVFSSLARRILLLNLGGLAALLMGFLYVNQFREGLIDARVQSLKTQGEIIAAAIAASANLETDAITLDPDKLLQLAPGESFEPALDPDSTQFSISPDAVGPVLRRLVTPTRTRARVYDRDGSQILDSRALIRRGDVQRSELPAPVVEDRKPTPWERVSQILRSAFGDEKSPSVPEEETAVYGPRGDPDVAAALRGAPRARSFVNARGQTIVSVAVPIQRFRVVRGALLLSTQGGDIDAIIAAERRGLLRVFLVAVVVMTLLSILLASGIAEPMRKLAEAAERVRRGVSLKARQEIPDYTDRADEIGHLSGALRHMTDALYRRIEAIESFAADVAHELKNPLTSLRSAVETLPRVKTDSARERLLEVIQHDVRRLDRLISDISDASRLDAELARGDVGEVDLAQLVEAVVDVANGVNRDDGVRVLVSKGPSAAAKPWRVHGHASRLGQVLNNLIDNARSFSAPGGQVRVSLAERPGAGGAAGVEILVDDDGPGIPAHAFERIFERFYTDRPNQGFGQNSGLGLSISRQIVEAHGGAIHAENRPGRADADGQPAPAGARFVVWLRAA